MTSVCTYHDPSKYSVGDVYVCKTCVYLYSTDMFKD